MQEDFFSELSKRSSGIDLAFALTGVLWLIGTVTAFYDMSLEALAVIALLWLSFFGFFYLVRRLNIKSTWWKALLVFAFLHAWKIFLTITISVMLT